MPSDLSFPKAEHMWRHQTRCTIATKTAPTMVSLLLWASNFAGGLLWHPSAVWHRHRFCSWSAPLMNNNNKWEKGIESLQCFIIISSQLTHEDISKKWAFKFILIIIDIKCFLTQGSENIKLYTGYAGYSNSIQQYIILYFHSLVSENVLEFTKKLQFVYNYVQRPNHCRLLKVNCAPKFSSPYSQASVGKIVLAETRSRYDNGKLLFSKKCALGRGGDRPPFWRHQWQARSLATALYVYSTHTLCVKK